MTKQEIIKLLAVNDRAVGRAVFVLNQRQTLDEQSSQRTRYRNSQGFNSVDAVMGTSNAQYFAKHGRLTERQLAYWRSPNRRGVMRIAKYAGQLLEIARERARAAQFARDLQPA